MLEKPVGAILAAETASVGRTASSDRFEVIQREHRVKGGALREHRLVNLKLGLVVTARKRVKQSD